MPGIIWLASYPKSGNTWLRAFIATYMKNPTVPLPINELRYHAFGDGFLSHYEKATGRKAEELSEDDLRRYRPQMHRFLGSHPTDTVFVKTHNLLGDESGVPLITPDITAGAIYVVRNPLDVVESFANHYSLTCEETVEILCAENYVLPGIEGLKTHDFVGSWSQHVESWIKGPGLRLHAMRYEDMLAKPGPTFRNLVKFLQLPIEPPRVRKAIKFTSFDELKKQENYTNFSEAPPVEGKTFFRKGQVGGWRDTLTDDQVARIVDTHRDYMQKFGYLNKKGEPV